MSDEETQLHWGIRKIFHYMRPCEVVGSRKIRVGSSGDGGYVMIDDFASAKVAYSLGIGGDVNWDVAMADMGLTIHQYDHTVKGPPVQHPGFRFNEFGISTVDDGQFISIPTAMRRNGDLGRRDLILKVDIEGSEWTALAAIPEETLAQFQQIVVEYHGFLRVVEPEWRETAKRALARLARQHAVHHVHANNWGSFQVIANVPVADVLEVSYIRRDSVSLARSQEIFPTALDAPCHPDRPDIFLGNFIFL